MPLGPADQEIALETLERMGGNLTSWEEMFIASLRVQMGLGRSLTARQVETLERLYAKRTG